MRPTGACVRWRPVRRSARPRCFGSGRSTSSQPHRVESFKFSNDPDFAPKVRDIVGLYLHPPDKAIVLSVDEKSQIQALDRTQPILPLRPGLPERQTHDLAGLEEKRLNELLGSGRYSVRSLALADSLDCH